MELSAYWWQFCIIGKKISVYSIRKVPFGGYIMYSPFFSIKLTQSYEKPAYRRSEDFCKIEVSDRGKESPEDKCCHERRT